MGKCLAANGLLIAGLLLLQPTANAVIYAGNAGTVYEGLSQAVSCVNHFSNRSSGSLARTAAQNAQAELAKELESATDATEAAEAIRYAMSVDSKPRKDLSVPWFCWRFISPDQGSTEEQVLYFRTHSTDEH